MQPSLTLTTSTTNNEVELKHSISTNDSIVKQKKRNRNSCVSLSSDINNNDKEERGISLESLLRNDDDNLNQIFITMPAKAAGTSLKEFTIECMRHGKKSNDDGSGIDGGSNFQEKNDNMLSNGGKMKKKFFYDEFSHKNTIITSHLLSENYLQNLIQKMPYSTKRASRGSLLIYVHRDETDRLVSSIRHIISQRVCGTWRRKSKSWVNTFNKKNMQLNETHCILSEEDVVNVIFQKKGEVGISGSKLLTCKTYKILEENNPLSFFPYDDDDDDDSIGSSRRKGGVLFMDYSQADKLQRILEKYHCPGMLSSIESSSKSTSGSGSAIHANVAGSSSSMQVLLKRRDKPSGDLVNLNDWLDQKRMSLEWALDLKDKPASCQSTTKRIEDNLYQCPDETMILSNSLLSFD